MQGQAEVNALVEAWIDHLMEVGGHTVIMPTDEMVPDTFALPATPNKAPPSKRQHQVSNAEYADTDADPESTPRPPLRRPRQSRNALSDTRSELSSTTDTNDTSSTTASQRSGRSSPRKKEAALRQTFDWPVERRHINDASRQDLVNIPLLELNRIAHHGRPLIPDVFRRPMEADARHFDPPQASWFYDAAAAGQREDDLRATHSRIQHICRNSVRCLKRIEHEPAWNEQVHYRILEEALENHFDDVGFRNLTMCRTLSRYFDGNPVLRENKVDYGIFLQPTQHQGSVGPGNNDDDDGLGKLLADLCRKGVDINHCGLSDSAPTPLAISIETKSLQANAVEGSVQLANWVRAHFRQLAQVVEYHGRDPADCPLPAVPLMYVEGPRWRVDFAERQDGKTVIFTGFSIGTTETIYGCYQICEAIRVLAKWVQTDFRAWWLGVLRDPRRGD
jgi:hypothetical protein